VERPWNAGKTTTKLATWKKVAASKAALLLAIYRGYERRRIEIEEARQFGGATQA